MPPRGPRGPRRGMMGGMPVSRSGKIMVNGHVVNPFAAPAGGSVHSPTQGPVDAYATYTENIKNKMRFAIQKHGPISGTIIGIHHILTNGLHMSMFDRRVAEATEELKAGKIDKDTCDLRKMQAAAAYFTYLKNIGYYDDAYVSYELSVYANKLGIDYDDSAPTMSH